MMETKRRREQRSMLPVHPDAAAIDIGATVHVAAVGPARDPQPVRSFGFEVRVVNARDAKHVPGRKTDVSDAAWLQRLHEFGLLRGSFRPQGAIAALRAYLRQRERLLDYAAAHIQHMQKALTQMNLQIHHVISDITGATGMRIIRAIVAGERDPDTLASYRDIRCHSSAETVRQALIGNYREEHLFAL
ncbi:MAG: IS110 family transposase, partial [Alphaproteobacteria bacterium]